jgi:hypothetical protein
VLGLKSAHVLRCAEENGPFARHGGLLHTVKPAQPGLAGRTARMPGAARWHVGRGFIGGRGAARCSAPAPLLRGSYAGQRERRWGSPRRSGGGGVAGSSRRGGVPVEGGFGEVVVSSGAVLWLEAEARDGTAGAALERRRKHGAGEKKSHRRRQHPFKGGDGGDAAEGAGESGDVWRQSGGE